MKFIPYFTGSSEKVVIAISLARIYVNNVAPISVDACLVHSDKLRTWQTLMHRIAWVAVKFGINTTLVVMEMVNFTRLRLVKFIPISNTTLMIFIPNFTATHAITSTNTTSISCPVQKLQ